jgi:hypothetical protein
MELGHSSSPACHVAATQSESDSAPRLRYDPEFQPAVTKGFLSPLLAYERGTRKTFAARISERHSISLERAYEVADNRMSLLAAIRLDRERKDGSAFAARIDKPQPERFGPTGAMTLVLLVVASLCGWNLVSREPAHEDLTTLELPPAPVSVDVGGAHTDTAAALQAATAVHLDDRKIATRVVGPDPRSVLIAVCNAVSPDRRLQLIDVRASFPPSADARLGIVRDVGSHEILVLHVHRDRSSGRWYAGDGENALAPAEPTPAVLNVIARR